MANIQICPSCGAANPADHAYCERCSQALSPSAYSREEPEALPSPLQEEGPLFLRNQQLHTEPERSHIKIVRPSNRRKFLVSLLGSGAILTAGSVGLLSLAQNVQVALNTKNYPYHIGDHLVGESYSSDLDFMAMVKTSEFNDPQAKTYIWDYQQQSMTTLPTGPVVYRGFAWSPDNKYLLVQQDNFGSSYVFKLWDVSTRQKISTYEIVDGADSSNFYCSPDGSRIALLSARFVVLSVPQLSPLFSFKPPEAATDFAWSPDGQKIAFLCSRRSDLTWSIQTWDLQTRRVEAEITFQGQNSYTLAAPAWSPDGVHIAAISHGQLQIIRVGNPLTSYTLDEPNSMGRLSWSPDGRHLAVAVIEPDISELGKFSVWDIVERKRVRVFSNATMPDALTWTKDGKYIRIIVGAYQQENWNW